MFLRLFKGSFVVALLFSNVVHARMKEQMNEKNNSAQKKPYVIEQGWILSGDEKALIKKNEGIEIDPNVLREFEDMFDAFSKQHACKEDWFKEKMHNVRKALEAVKSGDKQAVTELISFFNEYMRGSLKYIEAGQKCVETQNEFIENLKKENQLLRVSQSLAENKKDGLEKVLKVVSVSTGVFLLAFISNKLGWTTWIGLNISL